MTLSPLEALYLEMSGFEPLTLCLQSRLWIQPGHHSAPFRARLLPTTAPQCPPESHVQVVNWL